MQLDSSKNQYFISDFPKTEQKIFNGLIARKHAEEILQLNNWIMLQFSVSKNEKIISKILRLVQSVKFALFIPKKSRVIFFHPIYPTYSKIILSILSKRKSIHKILLIHDIESIRNQNSKLEKKETTIFKKFSFFLVHNDKMKEYFSNKFSKSNSISLDFFDYLRDTSTSITQRFLKKEVTFAGNIQKSPFVSQLKNITEVTFYLYGSNELIEYGENILNMGRFDSSNLPNNILGSFGLVWDGLAIYDISGSYGSYLKINSPHKASFYIVNNLPLIVHNASAIAKSVIELGIGWTISTLEQLPNLLNSISEEEYKEKWINVSLYGQNLARGCNLSSAIAKLIVN